MVKAQIIRKFTEILHFFLSFFLKEEFLLEWKPIHLCWWFQKHNLPIPKYFIGKVTDISISKTETCTLADSITVTLSRQNISVSDTCTAGESSIIGGNAIITNGSDQYGKVSSFAAISALGGNVTLEGWFYMDSDAAAYARMMAVEDTTNRHSCIQSESGTGSAGINFSVRYSGDDADGYSSDEKPSGQWLHMAVVGTNGAASKVYVNGTEISYNLQRPPTGTVDSASGMDFWIGWPGLTADAAQKWKGKIGGFIRVWSTARSATEINDNKSQHLNTTDVTGLIINLKFDERGGTTIANESDASNSATLFGTPTWTIGPPIAPAASSGTRSVSVSDTCTLADSIAVTITPNLINASETCTLADSIESKGGNGLASVSDTATLTDSITSKGGTALASVSDTSTLADSLLSVGSEAKGEITDTATITDVPTPERIDTVRDISVSSPSTLADSITSIGGGAILSSSDTATLADSIQSKGGDGTTSVTDSSSVSESIESKSGNALASLSDTSTLIDSIESKAGTALANVSDTSTITESISVTTSSDLLIETTDTSTLSDAIDSKSDDCICTVTETSTTADSLSITETGDIFIQVSDTSTVIDSLGYPPDVCTIGEEITITLFSNNNIQVSDTSTVSDSIISIGSDCIISVSDTSTLADALIIATGSYALLPTETCTIEDICIIIISACVANVSDTATVSDVPTVQTSALAPLDITVTETCTIVDFVGYPPDVCTVGESIIIQIISPTILISISDTSTLTDISSSSIGDLYLVISETSTLADQILSAASGAIIEVTDTATISESIISIGGNAKATIQDTSTTSDTLTAQRKIPWYSPDTFSIIDGDGAVEAGSLDDVWFNDNNYLDLEEVTGIPGYNYEFVFNTIPLAIVGSVQNLDVIGWYEGSVAHTVQVAQYNYTTLAWTTLGTIPANTSEQHYNFSLNTSSDYISGNQLTIRFYHTSPGNPVHRLHLDQVIINQDINISVSDTSTITESIAYTYSELEIVIAEAVGGYIYPDLIWVDGRLAYNLFDDYYTLIT